MRWGWHKHENNFYRNILVDSQYKNRNFHFKISIFNFVLCFNYTLLFLNQFSFETVNIDKTGNTVFYSDIFILYVDWVILPSGDFIQLFWLWRVFNDEKTKIQTADGIGILSFHLCNYFFLLVLLVNVSCCSLLMSVEGCEEEKSCYWVGLVLLARIWLWLTVPEYRVHRPVNTERSDHQHHCQWTTVTVTGHSRSSSSESQTSRGPKTFLLTDQRTQINTGSFPQISQHQSAKTTE